MIWYVERAIALLFSLWHDILLTKCAMEAIDNDWRELLLLLELLLELAVLALDESSSLNT